MSTHTNGGAPAPSGFTLLAFPGTANTDRHEAQAHGLLTIPTSPVLTNCIVKHARILAELVVGSQIERSEARPDTRRDTWEGETLWQTETGVAALYAHQKRLYERLDEATFDIIRCNVCTLRDVRAQAAYLWVHIGWRADREESGNYTLPILEALGVVDDDASIYEAMSDDERKARSEAIDGLVDRHVGDAVDLETQSRWLDTTAFAAWARAISGAGSRKGGAA